MKLKHERLNDSFELRALKKILQNASKTNEKLTMQTILICPLGASGKLGGRRFKTIWLCIFTNLSRLWFTVFCWNKTFSKWLFRSNASSHPLHIVRLSRQREHFFLKMIDLGLLWDEYSVSKPKCVVPSLFQLAMAKCIFNVRELCVGFIPKPKEMVFSLCQRQKTLEMNIFRNYI